MEQFAINHSDYKIEVGQVYEVTCGNGVNRTYRHMDTLETQERMTGKVALLNDVRESDLYGIGVMNSETGKVSCTVEYKGGYEEAKRILGF